MEAATDTQLTKVRPLDVEGLRAYEKSNPIKFKHKYGELDLDSIPNKFNLFLYKAQVARERARRIKELLDDETEPRITPELFAPKPVAPVEEASAGSTTEVVRKAKTK